MTSVLNIAAYRFVPLQNLPVWQAELLQAAQGLGLKGTVLLAEEGINLFLAGPEAEVRLWLQGLCQHQPFAGLRAKESWSEQVPFKRLRVKIKREIIRMNQAAVVPAAGRAPAVEAATLARWLAQGHDDHGRPVVTLDTRNRFEVDEGTFEGALDWNLSKFSDFPQALAQHAQSLRDKTVVSFCTGGIRCEKAALVMQEAGLKHAYQLEGGILQYFEDTDGAPHWRGRCVVFDERGSLDAELRA
ncbi:MAG: sulfurtransferase [Betaproteobacteria bacterium]|nr:sulfurtransferase [Betaproteobacteria bacterium]